jgi:hypothetical protein
LRAADNSCGARDTRPPADLSRARFRPIVIANSDAAAAAYPRIDQAYRAVKELLEG